MEIEFIEDSMLTDLTINDINDAVNGVVTEPHDEIHIIGEIKSELGFTQKMFCLNDHPFFSDIGGKNIPRDVLAKRFEPFYYAVHNWAIFLKKFLLVLINTHDDYRSATLVGENIMDEIGFVNGITYPQKAHPETFKRFLLALGSSTEPKINSAVEQFNNELDRMLQENSPAYLACVLGGIEHFYIDISNFLCNNLDSYLLTEQEHYVLHEILDEKHSMDFFKVASHQNASDLEIMTGVKKGYQMLWDVFFGLI